MKLESVFGHTIIETDNVVNIEYLYYYSRKERRKYRAYRSIEPLYFEVRLYFNDNHSEIAEFKKKDFISLITEVCEKMINNDLMPRSSSFIALKYAYKDSRCFKFKRFYKKFMNRLDDGGKLLLEIE